MRAVVVRHDCQTRLELAEVAEPIAGPDDVLVDVDYVALNPGELRYMESVADGARIGWDFTGRVARTAQNRPSPAEGAPVVGTLRAGAWAEQIAVDAGMIAELPKSVEMTEAVCLPVPAMTAFVSLRHGGFLYGKQVLVTGAAGAVGQYACQIALAAGAKVSAAVRRDSQVPQASCHGDIDVRVTEGVAAFLGEGPLFDLVVDIIGAGVANDVPAILKPGGAYVVVSAVGGESMTVPIPEILALSGQIHIINLFAEIERGPDTGTEILQRLLDSLGRGYLTGPVGPTVDWASIDEVARHYMASSDRAKPVLQVSTGED
ncbi:zinc-binding dehydrogenase [Pelagibius sp.]|uniref:zinc-binding dehydrogenase n=1 Tax=Pelagibius sp. TaxID=1931238 RepID=UPI003B50CC04